MVVPFQRELVGGCCSVLADLDQKARRADRTGERPVQRGMAEHWPQPGRCGSHDQPEGRGRRLGQGRLPQQEKRMPGVAGALVQPARRGEVEAVGIAARLQEDGGEAVQGGCLLGDPEGVGQPVGPRDQQTRRVDAKQEADARRIGISGLAKALGRPDPEDGSRRLLQQQPDKRQHEAGGRAGVAGGRGMDLGQAGAGQTAAECGVETGDAGGQKIGARPAVMPAELHILAPRPVELFGEAAFNPGDLMAQGRNGSPRHGKRGHGGASFEECSCYVPIDSRASRKSQADSWRIYSSRGVPAVFLNDGCSLETMRLNRYMAVKGSRMARIYQTRSWHDQLSPSMEEMEMLALEAYAHLPEQFRALTGEIVIQMAEFPTDEIMDDLSLETPFDLLGLFEGRGIAERWNPQTGEGPNRVTLYRRAILDYWAENEETLGSSSPMC